MESNRDPQDHGSFVGMLNVAIASRLLGLWVLYRVFLALYNVSPLHPLYGIPGPKMAAMSFLYEFWFDVVLHGRYTEEIGRMHKVYGPIVRINPEELHCADIDFSDEIYASGNRVRDKYQHNVNFTTGPARLTTFATIDHETHRVRRAALNRFFSRQQLLRLEPEVLGLVKLLCDKMLRQKEPFDVASAYSCLTSDVISQYAFGESFGFMAQPDWEPNFRDAVDGLTNYSFFFRFIAPARQLAHLLPYLTPFFKDDMAKLVHELQVALPARVTRALEDAHVDGDHTRVLSDLAKSSLPDSDKTVYRLSGEAFSFMVAGTETTAATLTTLNYYLLAQPSVLSRLAAELRAHGLDDVGQLSWTALEQLPYLAAVISEGQRLSYGVSSRLPRAARHETLRYRSRDGRFAYAIPPGTPVGMTAVLTHLNEGSFPDPLVFDPERWLDAGGKYRREMERLLITFTRGSRQCLGMNLAFCELYLTVAALALRVLPHLRLFQTTVDDVRFDHDLMVGRPWKGTKGVRVEILRED